MCIICAALRPYDSACLTGPFAGTAIESLPPSFLPVGDGGHTGRPVFGLDGIDQGAQGGANRQPDGRDQAPVQDGEAGSGPGSAPVSLGTATVDLLSAADQNVPQQLAAPQIRLPAISELADYLVAGFWRGANQAPRSFDTSHDNLITVDLSGLGTAGQALARDAMAAWSSVADLHFRVTQGSADIAFGEGDDGAYASTMTQGRRVVWSEINISGEWLENYGPRIGTYAFQVYLHEIGHALGLGHQGSYNGSGSFARDAQFTNDSWQASVMSYFSQAENPFVDASKAYAGTPMPADIKAIQSLYGAPGADSLTGGNTTYGVGHSLGGSWLGRIFSAQCGSDDPSIEDAREIAITIHDVGGRDVMNFSNDAAAQRVDLRMGGVSDIYGLKGNLQIAQGTLVEEYRAGGGGDHVTGNILANMIRGGGGSDAIYGGAGDDRLLGGWGADRLTSLIGNNRMWGGMGDDVLQAGWGADRLWGEQGHDRLLGGRGHDQLLGGNGYDTLMGGMGNDLLEGGFGNDRLFGWIGQDVLRGGPGNDLLRGEQGDDDMFGDAGCDTLVGGMGADILTGGLGPDTFRFLSRGDSTLEHPDLITDFQTSEDHLDLGALGFGSLRAGDSFNLPGVRWEHGGTETQLFIDLDGDNRPDMLIRLSGLLDLG